ncbi:MAG: iron-containing alcohol dehydrogenase [Spirochaetes bacterium]|nr:iron-containing alcohol dehydrogenase [Spirochaetota bacterium]
MRYETILTMGAANIKYGFGATREAGFDMKELGAARVMVVTDKRLAGMGPVGMVLESLKKEGIEMVLFDSAHVEPTKRSLEEAIRFAREGRFDGFVGIGGGSSMDTAKAANLYTSYPADFLAYVNSPIGEGRPVPGPLKPLICIPTTAGTGSETTGVVIFDYEKMQAKTGIAHRFVRPSIGIVDPDNTHTLPRMVAACTGFDVLVHAIESYTNLPFDRREAPETPALRPAYQGSNPISDVWAREAIRIVSGNIVRVVENPDDDEARSRMIIAATFAGIGFGNAGLHLPHGMSYPVSGMVKGYVPEGYPDGSPIVPHGMSVVLNAPAAFRFTGPSRPQRHLEAAALMGVDTEGVRKEDAGNVLADAVSALMKRTGMPNGLSAVGYTEQDADMMVEGTLPQHRITNLCPRPFTPDDLKRLFLDSMTIW